MKLLTLIFIAFFSAQVFAGASSWINFNLEGGHIKIPAKVANISSHIILDTGAQLNAINARFINKNNLSFNHGAKVKIQGVYGIENKSTYNNVPINVFGSDMTMNGVAALNLGYHDNAALFGSPFFEKFVIQFDYPNGKMRLINNDSIDLKKLENINLVKQKGSGMPIVEVSLKDGKSIWLLLDTGNSAGIILKRNVAQSMGWLESLEKETSLAMGANSFATMENFRIPWVKFGPFELENVLVSVPVEGQSINVTSQYSTTGSRIKGRRVQGLIGYDVLKHFLITLDYKRGHAHIGVPEE